MSRTGRTNSLVELAVAETTFDDERFDSQELNDFNSTDYITNDVVSSSEFEIPSEPEITSKGSLQLNTLSILCMTVVLVFGPMATIFSKLSFTMYSYPVPPSDIDETTELIQFTSALTQVACKTGTTFLWCFFVYLIERIVLLHGRSSFITTQTTFIAHRSLDNKRLVKIYGLAIIAGIFDFLYSQYQAVATTYLRTSTVQMVSSCNILIIAGLTMLMLRQAITTGEWMAIAVVMTGVVFSGIDGMAVPDVNSNNEAGQTAIALGYVLVSAFSRSFSTVLEQLILERNPIPLMKLYAIEQFCGLCCVGLTFLYLHFQGDEIFIESFWMFFNNPILFLTNFAHSISAAWMNSFAMVLGSLSNPIFRMLCLSARTVTTWFIEVFFGWCDFALVPCIGQIILAFGIIMYSGLMFPDDSVCFRRPLTINGRLNATEGSILTEKQQARMATREASIISLRNP